MKLLKWIISLFETTYQSEAEKYILKHNPKDAKDLDYWQKKFDREMARRTSQWSSQ